MFNIEDEMERDVYNRCKERLRLWAKDCVQLHEIAEIDQQNCWRNIIWLLLSLAVHLSVRASVEKSIILRTVIAMWKESENGKRHQSEEPR